MNEKNKCYGSDKVWKKTFFMCGGCADWWNYIIEFSEEDGFMSSRVYLEDKNGIKFIGGSLTYNIETEEITHHTTIKHSELRIKCEDLEIDFEFCGFDASTH